MHYRDIYVQHYGQIPLDEEGRTFEIHHRDGNRANNTPANLQCLSLADHYDLHFQQNDFYACLLMAERMSISPEEKSRLAKLGRAKVTTVEHCRKGGLKAAINIKKYGWSKEAVAKRVKTRKLNNSYNTDMSKCHTKEALDKRTKTRATKGVKQNMTGTQTSKAIFNRTKTRIINQIKNGQIFSNEVLIKYSIISDIHQ